MEQRQGTNAEQKTESIPMVPQGFAGPNSAEALHALLNVVPGMQHWPSGNDISSGCAIHPRAFPHLFRRGDGYGSSD